MVSLVCGSIMLRLTSVVLAKHVEALMVVLGLTLEGTAPMLLDL